MPWPMPMPMAATAATAVTPMPTVRKNFRAVRPEPVVPAVPGAAGGTATAYAESFNEDVEVISYQYMTATVTGAPIRILGGDGGRGGDGAVGGDGSYGEAYSEANGGNGRRGR